MYILLFFAALLITFSLAHPVHPTTAVPDNIVNYEYFVGWWETALIFLIFVAQYLSPLQAISKNILHLSNAPTFVQLLLHVPVNLLCFCSSYICTFSVVDPYPLDHKGGWHKDDHSCTEEKLCTSLATLFAAEFFFVFLCFYFPHIFPLS